MSALNVGKLEVVRRNQTQPGLEVRGLLEETVFLWALNGDQASMEKPAGKSREWGSVKKVERRWGALLSCGQQVLKCPHP